MPEDQSEILLKYKVDRASVQEALAADRQIQEQLNKTGKAGVQLIDINERLNKSIATGLRAQGVDAISQEFQQVLRDTGDVEAALVRVKRRLRDIGASDDEIKRVGLQIANIREQEQQQRSLGQNITRLGRGIFNAPAVGPSTPIARALIGGGAVVDKLGIDLKTLAAGAGVTAVAIGVVALALDGFNKGLAENKKQLEGALAAQRNYYQALATLTSDQVDAQIRQLQQTRPALEQQVQETRQALDAAFSGAQQTILGDVGARALFNQLPTGALQEAFDEAQRALQENIQTETRLTQGRESGAFATNDAAAAEEQLARLREEYAQFVVNTELSNAREFARASSLSSEERQREVEQIQHDIDALEEYRETHVLSAAAANQLGVEIGALYLRMNAIQTATSTWKDELLQLEAQQQAISDQTDNYFEALQREGEIRGEIAEVTQAIADAEAEASQRLIQAQEDRNERLADLEEDKADRIETIAQNSADRIAKIQRDLARSSFEAVAERDVLAKVKAEQTAADALEDQQKADARQLEQLDKQLAKQERSINRSYERQEQTINSSLARQVQTQQVALQRLNVDLQNAQFAQQAIALDGSNRQRIIHTQMWQDVYAIATNWAVNVSNVVNGILTTTLNFAQQAQQAATQQFVNNQIDNAFRTYTDRRAVLGRPY